MHISVLQLAGWPAGLFDHQALCCLFKLNALLPPWRCSIRTLSTLVLHCDALYYSTVPIATYCSALLLRIAVPFCYVLQCPFATYCSALLLRIAVPFATYYSALLLRIAVPFATYCSALLLRIAVPFATYCSALLLRIAVPFCYVLQCLLLRIAVPFCYVLQCPFATYCSALLLRIAVPFATYCSALLLRIAVPFATLCLSGLLWYTLMASKKCGRPQFKAEVPLPLPRKSATIENLRLLLWALFPLHVNVQNAWCLSKLKPYLSRQFHDLDVLVS